MGFKKSGTVWHEKEVIRMTPLNDQMDSGCFFRVMAINLLLGILSLRDLRENAIETANYKTYNYVIKHTIETG